MQPIELFKALVPVLVASIPVLVLAFQLRQQNAIERNRIEVEHLGRVLEVLELPIQSILDLQTRCDQLVARRQRNEQIDVAEAFPALARELLPAFVRHDHAIIVAEAFARDAHDQVLVSALDKLLSTSNAIRVLVGVVLDTATVGGIQTSSPRVDPRTPALAQSADAARSAASAVVARIRKLYR